MQYVLIYDLPSGESSLLVKINRMLHKSGAEKMQHSVWESEDIESLEEIATLIRKADGEATILEKRVVF